MSVCEGEQSCLWGRVPQMASNSAVVEVVGGLRPSTLMSSVLSAHSSFPQGKNHICSPEYVGKATLLCCL